MSEVSVTARVSHRGRTWKPIQPAVPDRNRATASGSSKPGRTKALTSDCGDGVARQMAFAGIPLASLRHVFITHQHSDHTADYGNLIWLAWTAGLNSRVDTWGPPPLDRMTSLFFEMNRADFDTRIANEGRVPLIPLVRVHELQNSGVVMNDGRMKVTATLVDHPPVVPAFAYRFDAPDRSIVISGDTAPSKNLVALAAGADVLVHSVMYPPAIDRLVARVPNAAAPQSEHSGAPDVSGRCRPRRAGRRRHDAGPVALRASRRPERDNAMWLEAAQRHFKGPVIAGKDLLEI